MKSKEIFELLSNVKSKGVVVCGSGITGQAATQFLSSLGARVTVIDDAKLSTERTDLLNSLGASKVLDDFSSREEQAVKSELADSLFAVLSPGISKQSKIARTLDALKLQLLSEIDLAVSVLGMPKVAVTGTNGKTTTVHLIHEMLTAADLDTALVGNVGKPYVSLIDKFGLNGGAKLNIYHRSVGHVVAEISSYQLEQSSDFHPHIAVWLNLADDHLERHGSIEEYLQAKAKIFTEQNQQSDWSILNKDDPFFTAMLPFVCGKLLVFGIESEAIKNYENYALYSPDLSCVRTLINGTEETFNLRESKLLGSHNASNLCAAIASARLAGASKEAIQNVIEKFEPLSHRLEVLKDKRGIVFVNDSKGTNVSSVVVALDAVRNKFPEGKVVLLLGGETKRASWAPLAERIQNDVCGLIGFGADGGKVLAEVGKELKARSFDFQGAIQEYRDLETAVKASFELANQGDVILLSPGGASFDAYNNYAERGEHFKSLVER